jgi:uncharacterized Zn-binding protein involved in type VI secretion
MLWGMGINGGLNELLAMMLIKGNLPKACVRLTSKYGDIIITPVGEFKVKGSPVACLYFGDAVKCYDQNGNEANPANVIVR